MSESIGDLHIALRASADKIASDINAGLNASQGQIQARAVALGTVIAAGITAGLAGLAASIKSAVGMGFEGLDRIDALDEAAAKIGATYNGLQDLKFAAESTGGSFEGMVGALAKMQGNLASGSASEALQRLRLDADALRQLTPEKQFAEIADRLAEIKNTGDKIDLTKQIFGKGGVDIMNVINQGKAGLSEMSRIVQELGGHMTAVQVAMVSMANDNMDKLKAGWGFVKDQIAVGITPAIVALSSYILKLSGEVGGVGPLVQGWVTSAISFGATLATIAQVVEAIGSLFYTVGAAIGAAAAIAVSFMDTVKAGLTYISNNAVYVFKTMAVAIADGVLTGMNSLKNGALKVLNDIATQGALVGLNVARSLDFTGVGSQAFDSTEKILKDAAANYQPTSVVPDFPTGAADGGPQSMLFPGGNAEMQSGLADLVVDYTAVETKVTDLTNAVSESGSVLADQIGDTQQKMDKLVNGEFYGDKIRDSYAQAKAAMEAEAQTRVATAANTGAAVAEVEKVNADNSAKITDSLAQHQVESMTNAAEEIQRANQQTAEAFQSMNRNVVTDMVTSWATGTGKISDIISQWAGNMLKQFVQLSLFGNGGSMGGLTGMLMGGGGGASMVGSIIGGLFGSAHAKGGRPAMGKIALIGEKGPELWAPDSAGTIIPNNRIASFAPSQPQQQGGGGAPAMESPIIINQSFATGVTHADLAGAMDSVLDQTRNAVAEGVSRGGGFRRSIQR